MSPEQTLDISSIWLSDTSFISAEMCVCVFVQQVTVSSQDMGQKRHSIDQLTFSFCVHEHLSMSLASARTFEFLSCKNEIDISFENTVNVI